MTTNLLFFFWADGKVTTATLRPLINFVTLFIGEVDKLDKDDKEEIETNDYKDALRVLLNRLRSENHEKSIQEDIEFIMEKNFTVQAENLKYNRTLTVADIVRKFIK